MGIEKGKKYMNNFVLKQVNVISAKQIMQAALYIVTVVTVLFLTKSMLLAALLCVSASTAARIAAAAYSAYKAGRSIRAAVAVFTGPGALAWMAVDFLIGWGIGRVFATTWLINA